MRLNRVFELNKLPYGPYLEEDSADAGDDRGKQVKPQGDEGSSKEKAPVAAARKRKLGMGDDETGPRATGSFVEELMETCAVPRGIDVFARAPRNFFAHAEGYPGPMA